MNCSNMALKRSQLPVLRQLCHCNKYIRNQILEQGGKPLQHCLRECALNVIKGNVPLSKSQLKKLKKHKKHLRDLSRKNTSLKKRIQIEQRGGFLASLLLPIVGSLAGAAIRGAIKR